MSEMQNPNPDETRTALTASEFASWYEKIADELDLEAMHLQMQVADNPYIVSDPDYKLALERLAAQQQLIERVGEDFSDYTIRKTGELLLKDIFEEE